MCEPSNGKVPNRYGLLETPGGEYFVYTGVLFRASVFPELPSQLSLSNFYTVDFSVKFVKC